MGRNSPCVCWSLVTHSMALDHGKVSWGSLLLNETAAILPSLSTSSQSGHTKRLLQINLHIVNSLLLPQALFKHGLIVSLVHMPEP